MKKNHAGMPPPMTFCGRLWSGMTRPKGWFFVSKNLGQYHIFYIFFIDHMPPLDSGNSHGCLSTTPSRFRGQKYRKMGGSWATCSICCKKSLKIAANYRNRQREAPINSKLSWSIYMVVTHLLINFERFEATGRLCSNLPKFAATPKITKICHFEAKWQLAIGENALV